ncbi:IclR family transcriptional regulator [Pseudonocardia sp. GCM10023141]|uniref:IclR family transcriptional regulator n=1 Tax=Pseudonocardia sp. GCM10023141 TaxID=3252653 RepID=UPI00360C98E8
MAANSARDPVGRALDLLTWLAEHGSNGPMGVREIARAMGTSPTTAHRLLQAFEERSLVRRDGNGAYYGGLELVRLGRLASRFSVHEAARPVLEKLSADVDETSMLGLYDPQRGELMLVDAVQTSHPLRYLVQLDSWRPLWAGAAGLGVLAFLPDPDRARVLREHPPARITPSTPSTPTAVEEFCTSARAKGYALTRGQRTEGAVGIAAPIRDADGHVVGDVCLTVPDNRFREADEERFATALTAAAEQTSTILMAAGYRLAAAGPDVGGRARR